MSNFTKEIPKSNLAASVLLISLFFVQVIVEISLRLTAYEDGQPSWAWAIGGSFGQVCVDSPRSRCATARDERWHTC